MLADCVSFVQPRLFTPVVSRREKRASVVRSEGISVRQKICVSTFCQGARGRRSEPLASFSEERQSLIGLLFHSICRPASCRPQLHTFEPATVTLHTSLQPASCTLPLTADRSCLSSDTHCRLMCGLQSYMLVMRLPKTLAGTCVNVLLELKLRMNCCQFIQSFSPLIKKKVIKSMNQL